MRVQAVVYSTHGDLARKIGLPDPGCGNEIFRSFGYLEVLTAGFLKETRSDLLLYVETFCCTRCDLIIEVARCRHYRSYPFSASVRCKRRGTR